MKMKWMLAAVLLISFSSDGQLPCSKPEFRQFDFWIGEWDVYSTNGQKAGNSRVTLMLDSCVIFEEWISAIKTQGVTYAGKSFNKYNPATRQWQQTWVDNVGGSIEFLKGKHDNNRIIFETGPFLFSKDTMAIRRLTFFDMGKEKVRQFGEISKDNRATWKTEYDLEYRRKKKDKS